MKLFKLRRTLLVLPLAAAALAAALAGGASARATKASVKAFPSSTPIPQSGGIAGGTTAIDMNVAVGEREGAWVVISGAKSISAGVEPPQFDGLTASLSWGHFVRVGARRVADALLPWDGSARTAEAANQGIYVQVNVPFGTAPGLFRSTLSVTADGAATPVTLNVRVYPVSLPPLGRASGAIPTSFHVGGESYLNKADSIYHFKDNAQRQEANAGFYKWLTQYRISPAGYGFGEPKTAAGYTTSKKWWLDSATNMSKELEGPGFPAMRIPISNNRTAGNNNIAGLSPSKPGTWCEYLNKVHTHWGNSGWLGGSVVPYLYGQDEPGEVGQRLVQQQSAVAHKCFPGARVLMTGNPSPTGANEYLWDNQGNDDVDIWTPVAYRFYGSFTVPAQAKEGASRERQLYAAIEKAHKRGKQIWTYQYEGVPGTPGFTAVDPLFGPRMFMLWNALEGTQGMLYGQGTTTYGPGNPLDALSKGGAFVLIYPGETQPIPSARLEQVRDGIEDWEILNMVRKKRGAAAVRTLLGRAGLFSANAKGVQLGCTLNCDVVSETKYAWPLWSHDATTPAKIDAAKKQALALAR